MKVDDVEHTCVFTPNCVYFGAVHCVHFAGGLTPTPSHGGHGDEASSDSAVSMGSASVGSPDQVCYPHLISPLGLVS